MNVESYKIKGWKNRERGLLISENEEWILVKHLPVDFVVDGFKLYRKKFIKNRSPESSSTQTARVLSLKQISESIPEGFEFGDTTENLKWCEKKYGLFEFQDKDETELFYGKINSVEKDKLIIDLVNSKGKLIEAYDFEFSLKRIRVITFETDYFESIRLLMNDLNQPTTKP